MKTNKRTIFVIVCGLALISTCFAQPRYTSSPIQIPPGFSSAALTWISDDGKTGFGSGWNVLGATSCFTYQDGSYTTFSTPDSGCGTVRAGNTRGEFVGTLSPPLKAGFGSVPEDAFVYRNGDFMQLNDLLPGQPPVSFAMGINENGDVAGVFQTFYTFSTTLQDGTTRVTSSPSQQFAFVYSNGQVRLLPDLGAQWSAAYAINSNGDVVGDSVLRSDLGPADIPVHAAIFPHDGGIIDLGTFGGPRSSAVAINSKGQVAGWANLDANNSHAFFYDGGMMTEIPLPGGNATSINDGGEVVGTYWPDGDQSQHAFYYSGGNAVDLNTLTLDLPAGVVLESAQRITNQGLILVSARKSPDEPLTQFLLTPVAGS
jgi:probable HAF family extracellular repeat protein